MDNKEGAKYCKNCGNLLNNNQNYSNKKSNHTILKIVLLLLTLVIVAVAGVFVYIVYFDASPVEITMLSSGNAANIMSNDELASNIPQSNISNQMTQATTNGIPIYKIGDGSAPVSVISAGVHGDQLVPVVAAMQLINFLDGRKIKGTVYVIPFSSPVALSQNTKLTNGVNLNRVADQEGTISNEIVKLAMKNNASATGDFHETEIGKNPGKTTIMCSEVPTYNSYQLASSMCNLAENTKLSYFVAGITYDGAIEDTLNLNGTPAVTPVVVVSTHGKVYGSAVKESFAQMLSLLLANRNLDPNDDYLKLANADIDGFNI